MKEVLLRHLRFEDALLLFEWANDSDVRKNSFNSKTIDKREHLSWFESHFNSHNTVIYILEHQNVAVGQLRYQIEDGIALTNFSIAAEHRGQGYGSIIVSLSEKQLISERLDVYKIVARVKHDNIASCSVFEKNYYTATNQSEYITFEKVVR